MLAVDPSSPFSGGALLGDRVRMGEHSADPGVYIRSMSSRGELAVRPRPLRAAADLFSAIGFNNVLVETVGVGQNEIAVMRLADTVVVVLAPGMGDGIQAAKAGILETADVLVVNKSDHDGAAATVRDLKGDGGPRPGRHRLPGGMANTLVVSTAASAVGSGGGGIDESLAAVAVIGTYLPWGGAAPRRLQRAEMPVQLLLEVNPTQAGRTGRSAAAGHGGGPGGAGQHLRSPRRRPVAGRVGR